MTTSVQSPTGSPYPLAGTPSGQQSPPVQPAIPAPAAARPAYSQDQSGFTPTGVAPVRIDDPAADPIAKQIHAAALEIAKQMMAAQAPTVAVTPSGTSGGNTITVSQPGNPGGGPVVVTTPATQHDDATTTANDATQIALRTPHLAATFRALLPYVNQAYSVGNDVLNEAAKYSVPLLKNTQFRNIVLDEAEKAGGKDGRALAESAIKGLIKSNGKISDAVAAAMKSFGKIRGVNNPATQIFTKAAKGGAAAMQAAASATKGKSAEQLMKEAATDATKNSAAAKKLGTEIVEKGAAANIKGVKAFLPNVGKAFSVIGVGLSGASFLQVLKNPKSTLADKIAHGIHFAANIVGIWQPEVGLLADLAMMGVDGSGKLKAPKTSLDGSIVTAPEASKVDVKSNAEQPVKVERHPAGKTQAPHSYAEQPQPA